VPEERHSNLKQVTLHLPDHRPAYEHVAGDRVILLAFDRLPLQERFIRRVCLVVYLDADLELPIVQLVIALVAQAREQEH
jgi:hypothetical protein